MDRERPQGHRCPVRARGRARFSHARPRPLLGSLPSKLSLREGEDLRRRRFRDDGAGRRPPLPCRQAGSDVVTFPDAESAVAEGHVVTHRRHCGTCSSLRDLAAYMARPNLASPARTCARKLTAGGVKKCLMEEIGLSERCAETWTYKVLHTRRHCAWACIGHHGLWNVLTKRHGRSERGRGRQPEPLSDLRRTHLRHGFPVRGGTHAALLGAHVGDPPATGRNVRGRSLALLSGDARCSSETRGQRRPRRH